MVRRGLEPEGRRAGAARNAEGACGKRSSSARKTVSPPKPESKTPMVGVPEPPPEIFPPEIFIDEVLPWGRLPWPGRCGRGRRGRQGLPAAGHRQESGPG